YHRRNLEGRTTMASSKSPRKVSRCPAGVGGLRVEQLEARNVPSLVPTFFPPVAHPLFGLTTDLAVADLNTDGNLDLIATHAGVNGQGNGIGPISILNGS